MELAELLKTLFETYGAAALPWSVIAFFGWFILREKNKEKEKSIPDEYEHLIDKYHEALIGNTRTIERLAVLLEERTRRQADK